MIRLDPAFLAVPLAHRALHRPGSERLENSRAAIRAAMEHGYGIEIDVQMSSDGVAMVFHDDNLDRLTNGAGPVRAHSAAGLAGITLNGTDEGIPTLAEVLALVAGRVPLLIEVKDQHGQMGETDGMLEEAVVRDLAGYEGAVALMSFNPHSVIRLAKLAPTIPRGIVTCDYAPDHCPELTPQIRDRLRAIPDMEAARASFISHQWDDLDRPRVAELKAAGADILCWTIRSQEAAKTAGRIAQNITFEGYLPALPA
ncbi:glycerophosphodiester phosphodiesterase family protein [Roseovarius nanhaiticus]|uniref:glycerophosphodiester phosphodiesterase family protein n=1 Tax=Roseovarius nanhaiticus TaxID=573024 RepID=UPI00248FD34C|nr:glycerophosphodiester phosphodiesterase family protein [Roseovarius nanhaiticus]